MVKLTDASEFCYTRIMVSDTTVIEVTCDQTGDTALCEDSESAIVAGRTLGRDAWEARPIMGYEPTLTFRVDGEIVRRHVAWETLKATVVYA